MESVINFVVEYWGIIAVVLGGGAWVLGNKKIAIAFAGNKIKSLMLAAEKGAESLVLENGSAKMDWVVEKGYALLPPVFKLLISKEIFRILVQSIFDEAKDLVNKHSKK